MSAPVQLVFRGELLAGFRLEDVQRELGRLLQADEVRLKSVFSGRRTVLKRGLPPAEAQRYVSRLAAMGAYVHVEPMPTPPPTPAAGDWPTIAPPPEADRQAPAPVAAAVAVPKVATPAATPAPSSAPPSVAVPTAVKELALVPEEVPAEAAGEVTCPKCGERQSKRLLCRACATNIEMGLAAKEEEQALRRAERQAALEARRHPRRRATPDAGPGSAWPIGLSFAGRVGRLSSASANLWLLAAMLLLTTGFLARPSLPRALLMGAGALGVFFFSMRLTVLRCHDCDRHGWWALFVLVPYVGSLASLLFGFLPGNPDENDYGPPPPRGRWLWFGVATLVLVLSTVLLVRAGIRFAERYADEAKAESAEDLVDLGGGVGSSGGSSGNGAAGLQDALREYAQAPGHKAFAASSRQNFAWVGNAATMDEAVRNAMSQCDAHRPQYTPQCRVVYVNRQPATN